ncbi:MAG: type III-A CRISPR-associated protein Cas10/Csm1 [Thermogutta sp.]
MKSIEQLINRTHLLAAAGLWHDLGKVGEPARAKLNPHIANLNQMACPTDRFGRYTHRHVLYTAQLFETAQKGGSNFGRLDQEALFRIAVYHHKTPSASLDEAILTKADWLASGHDRRQIEAEDQRDLVLTGLKPIMASLSMPRESGRVGAPANHMIIFPGILEWNEQQIFPSAPLSRDEYSKACGKLWKTLEQGVALLAPDRGEYIERLQALLYRTLHAVPATRQTGQQADVPLYDHSHLTAAFAACLGCLYDAETTQESDPNQLIGRYRILQLAVGNIQPFIVRSVAILDSAIGETAEKGMARRLRARSFLVSLLTWLAAKRVLEAAGLPMVNLIFDGGGRAILLLPDHAETLDRIHQALHDIDEWFANTMGGLLRWDVAWSRTLTDDDFKAERFLQTYCEVTHSLAEARYSGSYRRLRNHQGWKEDAWVFKDLTIHADRQDFQERLAKIGRFLPKAKYLSITDGASPGEGPSIKIFRYTVELLEQAPHHSLAYALDLPSERLDQPVWLVGSHVPVVNRDNRQRLESQDLLSGSDSYELLEVGDVIPFDALSQLSEDEEHNPLPYPMLAALKADVDHLGLLLSRGLGDSVSFGRLATLARSLNQFFKGFLTRMIAQRYPHIYTIFAGGDDLFLIGPWFDVVRLTVDLHEWFQKFVCQNGDVTFSAGIVFAHSRIPIRHLAYQAEKALDEAKESGRNRVTITSLTMDWDSFKRGVALTQLLSDIHGRQPPILSTALVYRLLQYANMALRPTKNITDLKWRAQMSYDIRRNLPPPDSIQHDQELQRLHHELAQVQTQQGAAALFVAAMLSLYSSRGGKS